MTPATAYRTGPRGRVFPTPELAAAYERGLADWPQASEETDRDDAQGAAYRKGWLDADAAEQEREDAREWTGE